MSVNNYPNQALADVCEMLLDEWELTPYQIKNLAADLPGECEGIMQNRNEAAFERHQERLMESAGFDDSTYRQQMIDAGRGHLLKG